MSYCRNNGKDSDVYVVATDSPDGDGTTGWWCCGCACEKDFFIRREDMLAHLILHRENGDKVPERALVRLRREMAETQRTLV